MTKDKAPISFKTCSKCKKVKSLSEFSSNKKLVSFTDPTVAIMGTPIHTAVRKPRAMCKECANEGKRSH